MASNRKIFGIGETVLDVIFKNDQPIAAVPGGSTFNAMISLGRSVGVEFPEIPIKMMTETGDDHIGDIVLDFMQKNHVSTKLVTRNRDTQTHISMAFLNENNDAQYEFYKDHAHASLNVEKAAITFSDKDILLFGSFFAINPALRQHTSSNFRNAHDAGAILYYDINFRKSHIKDIPDTLENIVENFSLSTVVRGSAEDFLYLFGTDDPQEVYEKYIKQYCPLFICTDGSKPLSLFTPNFSKQYPVAQIETVSTIGAGDNFNAGFIYGLIANNATKDSLSNIGEEIWDKLIESGQYFSAKVCQSMYNYI